MKSKKICSLAFSLLLFLLLPLGAFADTQVLYPEGTWSLSEESGGLFCNETEYERLPLSEFHNLHASVKHLGKITIGEDSYIVGASEKDPDLVFLYENSSQILTGSFHSAYYAKSRLSTVAPFLNGVFDGHYLDARDADRHADSEKVEALYAALKSHGDETDVTLFYGASVYKLYGTYKGGALTTRLGAFYKTLNAVYYVDYASLPNSAFNSDGALSLREGNTVPALLLEGEQLAFFEDTLENGDELESFKAYGDPPSPVIFWIMLIASSAVLGFILPLVPLVLSIVMLIRKKTLYPYRYVILSVLSLLWMLLFLLIFLVLLI